MFDIQQGDLVCFKLIKEEEEDGMEVDNDNNEEDEEEAEEEEEEVNKFTVSAYRVVNNIKEEKPVVGQRVLGPVDCRVRPALQNIEFTDIFDITEEHMVAINFALYKTLCIEPTEKIEEEEFYVKTNDRKYLVHKIIEQNEMLFGLLVPHRLLDGYDYKDYGSSVLWKRGLAQPIAGQYHAYLGMLLFDQGMEVLINGEDIQVDITTVMVRVIVPVNTESIRLELAELIN